MKQLYVKILQEIPTKETLAEKVMEEVISLEEKIAQLKSSIEKRVNLAFREVIVEAKDKIEVIVTFLALLEMIKQQVVSVKQAGLFEEIMIEKR